MASVTVAGGRQVFDGMGEDAEEWQGKWKSLLRCENGIMSQVAKAKWSWTRAPLTYEWGGASITRKAVHWRPGE